MPSDPSGTHPGGVLVRPAADFFDDNMGLAMVQQVNLSFPPGDSAFYQVGLFNNAIAGLAFKVYGISVTEDGGGGFLCAFVKAQVGATPGVVSGIRPDISGPFGLIGFDVTIQHVPSLSPFVDGTEFGLIGSSGFDSNTVLSPFPMFVIPVGWSLVLRNPEPTFAMGASFWYQQANE
jgi:hypothetical protein